VIAAFFGEAGHLEHAGRTDRGAHHTTTRRSSRGRHAGDGDAPMHCGDRLPAFAEMIQAGRRDLLSEPDRFRRGGLANARRPRERKQVPAVVRGSLQLAFRETTDRQAGFRNAS